MLDDSYERAEWNGDRVRVRAQLRGAGEGQRIWLTVRSLDGGACIEEEIANREALGKDAYEALRNLQEDVGTEPVLLCCGNCCFLQLTGMSRQMSSGYSGYCLVYFPEHGRSKDDLVSIFDYCDCFTYGPDEVADPMRMRLWQEQARPCNDGAADLDGE